ncbi:hypothetical protein C7460_11623 [Marinoscillum furvescens DSM 4134]|uniref:Uncharacterized protein n=1 Tax=Marinoscillum furvescens DSM 4134 TaxID=1122208 RepID=A0A3D9L1U5_MARFU|nr:hypothetical protein C7460_11623 [Marinoscillum furvescens DSM 4134]
MAKKKRKERIYYRKRFRKRFPFPETISVKMSDWNKLVQAIDFEST